MPAVAAAPVSAVLAKAPGAARFWRGLCVVASAALLLALVLLANQFIPGTEAVRVRNSFLLDAPLGAAFEWWPPAAPAGFLQQSAPAPENFVRAAALAEPRQTVIERVIAMVNHLNPGRRRGGPIQASTAAAYEIIAATGTGYCADYTQVMNGLAWAAGIPVREWGMSFDGFGGLGHAFNEVYDAGIGKWVMVDAFNGFWVRDRATNRPLSALEFRERLLLASPLESMELVRFRSPAVGFKSPDVMIDDYRRGVDQFYLWWGNNVFDYDARESVRLASSVSRGMEQVVAIAIGVHPRIRILPTPTNGPLVAALESTRWQVVALAGIGLLSLVLCIVSASRWRRAVVRAG